MLFYRKENALFFWFFVFPRYFVYSLFTCTSEWLVSCVVGLVCVVLFYRNNFVLLLRAPLFRAYVRVLVDVSSLDRLPAASDEARPGRPGVRGEDLWRGPAVPRGHDEGVDRAVVKRARHMVTTITLLCTCTAVYPKASRLAYCCCCLDIKTVRCMPISY